ncbi:MAG: thermonuclease family protein [Undibacterium sp.]|nr:thermonuclease family protein [Opitutaceae bacterium]
MAAAPDVVSIPRTYAELRREVERVLLVGRRAVDVAWLRTYHETGRLIHEHLRRNEDRADYGAKVVGRLAAETEVSTRVLYQCVQFYRCFPIVQTSAQLGWSHYQLLCQVIAPAERKTLAAQAVKQQWTVGELQTRVRALNAAPGVGGSGEAPCAALPAAKLLTPKLGTVGRYRVIARDDGLAVDVGFKLYRPLAPGEARGLKAGAIVGVIDSDAGIEPAPEAKPAHLFTYRVKIGRVIDGDTLLVTILLPQCQMDEKLRLRGLDCPEMDTPAGKAAKRYVETLLVETAEVIITTSKVDKYDRYLADVHLRQRSGETIFLNNALLVGGHAVPMGEAQAEWTP